MASAQAFVTLIESAQVPPLSWSRKRSRTKLASASLHPAFGRYCGRGWLSIMAEKCCRQARGNDCLIRCVLISVFGLRFAALLGVGHQQVRHVHNPLQF